MAQISAASNDFGFPDIEGSLEELMARAGLSENPSDEDARVVIKGLEALRNFYANVPANDESAQPELYYLREIKFKIGELSREVQEYLNDVKRPFKMIFELLEKIYEQNRNYEKIKANNGKIHQIEEATRHSHRIYFGKSISLKNPDNDAK